MARKMTLLSRRSRGLNRRRRPFTPSPLLEEATDHALDGGESGVSCIAGKSLSFPSNHVALASDETP